MAEIIRMPRMSDTMEEGNIVAWLKKEGDKVESGQTIAEVETDKATMELDTYTDGVLLHIAVKEGPVPIDGIIAVIGQPGEDWQAAIAASQGSNGAAPPPSASSEKPSPAPQPVSGEPSADEASDQRVKASPLARNIAKEAGVDLGQIQGSGDSGRIVKRDVEAAMQSAPAPAKAPAPKPVALVPSAVETPAPVTPAPSFSAPVSEGGAYEEVNLSQMRKVIARRLSESKFSAPHFYLTVEINMDKAIQMRARLNEVAPVKLSFNDLVIKAAALSLRQHPAINASWLGDKIRYHNEVHIGVAVAIEEGLLVPVIRHADMKSLSQINTEVKNQAAKAKDRKLQPEEMQGNTFTISNLGMFGIEEFTAIINPPDACILAVGGIIEKPVVQNGQIVVGNTMKVTLSCDHRVVDGAKGAAFLQTLRQMLEDPIRMLV
ncbi:MAG: pyruvate dehydrogenase complex dihydrolipoamide acetyltransferase [Haliscomenobacter sp.]|nr:pyruvate dehydrogenase complex dihydrolipoamide acetyltransferase [Haliscomenobacter sp.]MBK7475662.1 pyruvate dehydrogenase complex dihydrolipoamide acetyltransferase [Haliscomenobacter sp.]